MGARSARCADERERTSPALHAAWLALALAACNLDNAGTAPPEGTLSYPVGIATSSLGTADGAAPRYLYVVNSNFDLTHNAGSVQSYDLARLEAALERAGCREPAVAGPAPDAGTRDEDDLTVRLDAGAPPPVADAGVVDEEAPDAAAVDAGSVPSGTLAVPTGVRPRSAPGALCGERDFTPDRACCFQGEALDALRASEQRIDSFATGLAVWPRPGRDDLPVVSGRERLYVPSTNGNRLVYIDVDPANGRLLCDDAEPTDRCRRATSTEGRDIAGRDVPAQPSAFTVGALSELGFQGHEPFIATAHERGGFALFVDRGGARGPQLESAISGLPQRPVSVTLDPFAHFFYVTGRTEEQIPRVGVARGDEGYEAYTGASVILGGVYSRQDVRDMAVDPDHQGRVYALIGGFQESVVYLERDPRAVGGMRVVDVVRIGAGPSKIEHISLLGRAYLLVTSYDARSIFVLDAGRRQLVSVVRDLSGPFEMTWDEERQLLYVADFRASVVRVVDLAWLADPTQVSPRIVATLGQPRFQGGLE